MISTDRASAGSSAWTPLFPWQVFTQRLAIALVCVCLCCLGCRSKPTFQADKTLARHAKAARAAYTEGALDEAVKQYRLSLYRAWAMDDPYESGTAAYNLAACLTSQADYQRARDLLVDARIELCRADSSVGNVWLLESVIAQQECRYEDASYYLQWAGRTDPPCQPHGAPCRCKQQDPCQSGCYANLPCVGPKLAAKKTQKDCQREYEALIQLGHARVAAEQYQTSQATGHLRKACELAGDSCSHEFQAELQDVAALIHLSAGEFLQAAQHLDSEALHLRLAGDYRVIPDVLELSARAYEQAARFDLAALRMARVAKIWLGRGDPQQAWRYVMMATELAQNSHCQSDLARLALIASEIERELDAVDKQPEAPDEIGLMPAGHDLSLAWP